MVLRLFAAIVMLLMVTSPLRAVEIHPEFVPAPEWVDVLDIDVTQLSSDGGEVGWRRTPVLNDYQVRYTETERVFYRRNVFRVEENKGNAIFVNSRRSGRTKFVFHAGIIHHANGSQTVLTADNLRKDVSLETVYVSDLETGDILDIRYSEILAGPLELSLLTDWISMGPRNAPTERLIIRVPEKFPVKGVDEQSVSYIRKRIEAGDQVFTSAIGFEEDFPLSVVGVDKLGKDCEFGVSALDTWEDASVAYYRLLNRPLPTSLDIIEVSNEIRMKSESRVQLLQLVADYIDDHVHINTYYSADFESDWDSPNFADVFRFRSCADFECTALVSEMLRELGFEFERFLGWGYGKPKTPYDGLTFNGPSVLFRVKLEQENYWLDITSFDVSLFEQNAENGLANRFKQILALSAAGDVPIKMDVPPASAVSLRVSSEFELQNGLWTVKETVDRNHAGYPILPDVLTRGPARLSLLSRSYPRIKLLKYEDKDKNGGVLGSKVFSFDFEFSSKTKGTHNGERRQLNLFVDELPEYFRKSIDLFSGGYGSVAHHPHFIEIETTAKLTGGVEWSMDAEPVNLRTPYFELSVDQTKTTDTVTRLYRFKTLQDMVPKQDRADHVANLERALELVQPWAISYQPSAE